MSITNALSNAVSGMHAASRQAEITAHNVANASTDGYARQRIGTVQQVVAGRGAGVDTKPVERASDPRLTASRREADAHAKGQSAGADAVRQVADSYGSGTDSLSARLDSLETGLRAVSETPGSGALQNRAVVAATDVVDAFADISGTIQGQRSDADSAIGRAVDEVNNALQEIERLNADIGSARIGGDDHAALQQARDAQIDIVASNLPIRLMSRPNGQVAMLTDTGATLLDAKASTLAFTPSPIVTADMDYKAGTGPLSGLSVNGVDLTPGGGTQAVSSGFIAEMFNTRDTRMVEAQGEIDTIAADIVSRFEGAGVAGADGRGLFTDDGAALSSPASAGLAGRLRLNEAIDPAQGGAAYRIRDGLDATAPGPAGSSAHATALLDAMTELRTPGGALFRAGSAAGLAADLGSVVETRAQFSEDSAALAVSRQQTFVDAESAVIGVDLDVELQNLIRIEQAYGANAKVIEVADRLVQRLLEI